MASARCLGYALLGLHMKQILELTKRLVGLIKLYLLDITAFKIISESGVAAGVRRIEALTGENVFAYYKKIEEELIAAAKAAKATPATLTEKIEHMLAEIKALQSENESLKSKAAKEALGNKLTGNIIKEIYVPGKIVNIVAR